MNQIVRELMEQQNIRANLSSLRKVVREMEPEEARGKLEILWPGYGGQLIGFLKQEDAKTRKNAALLLGDLQEQQALSALVEAYRGEETRFVRSSYPEACMSLQAEDYLPVFREQLAQLLASEPREEEKKHVMEEIRALRKLLIPYDGIARHTFHGSGAEVTVLLITNRLHRELIRRNVPVGRASLHPLGILVETNELDKLLEYRLFRELVFPVNLKKGKLLPAEPKAAAEAIWASNLMQLLEKLHRGEGVFYYRVDCRGSMTLEQRSEFIKRFAAQLENSSKGRLVNSPSDYEVEIRLIANRDGKFYPCIKLYTIGDRRFAYRKNSIAASIHPATAALMMKLAEPFLKNSAQVMDPFCGVGTMLIERAKYSDVHDVYGTDIFGEAIEKARENTKLAKMDIHYVHRDFFDFTHDYLFDELIANMPVRGKKTKEEMAQFYDAFFRKAVQLLKKDGIMMLYTNEIGHVKKQLRLHREYTLLQETMMQEKGEYYLIIIGVKGN